MGFLNRLKELKKFDSAIVDKKEVLSALEKDIVSKTSEIDSLRNEIERLSNERENATANRNKELEQTRREQENIIEHYKDRKQDAEQQYKEAYAKLLDTKKEEEAACAECALQEEKTKLFKNLVNQIRKNLHNNVSIPPETIYNLDRICPTVEIHLHSHDVKTLRKLANENNKIIKDLLGRYESRYSTKSNKAIYQLMVIALQAELQNILVNMKFSSYDKCKSQLKEIVDKYLGIATDGSQVIAPTLNNFISEIGVLFDKAIDIEYEYFIQREREREEQRALKEQMRQEAEERRALEQIQKQVEKEESKYIAEISNVKELITQTDDAEKINQLTARIQELQEQLSVVNQKKEEIISRQNGKAGYVYVISNLGSFGENTFKVGMTRRLEPMDRIKELGDASVPFAFDVHSFIFSDDAVGLETELHNQLYSKRKNKINMRKEFFDVSIDELEALVEKIDPSAEFNRTMVATEYRRGLELNAAEGEKI